MGMSGSYGGSEAQRWEHARERLSDLLSTSDADAADRPEPLVQAIVDALVGDDPSILSEPEADDELDLPPPLPQIGSQPTIRRRGGSGTGGGTGGVVRGRSSGSSRSSSGQSGRRRIGQGVRRGGVALGSAYALRRGDPAALRELGLDLGELRAMSPRQQRMALLNATIGATSHPDDVALRRAADQFLKVVLTAESEPEPIDLLRDFVAAYINSLGLVELGKELAKGTIDQAVAVQREREIRDWTRVRLRRESFGIEGPVVSFEDFQKTAARLAATAFSILRGGAS